MSVKLIAIGNRLMGDDSVAICIASKLSDSLKKKGIEVIIGETDFQYCLHNIEETDRIILVDATCFGITPGSITVKTIADIYKSSFKQSSFSQHGYSIINALKSYYSDLEVLVIGIEGVNFDFCLSLSDNITNQLENICNKVEILCGDFVEISYI